MLSKFFNVSLIRIVVRRLIDWVLEESDITPSPELEGIVKSFLEQALEECVYSIRECVDFVRVPPGKVFRNMNDAYYNPEGWSAATREELMDLRISQASLFSIFMREEDEDRQFEIAKLALSILLAENQYDYDAVYIPKYWDWLKTRRG